LKRLCFRKIENWFYDLMMEGVICEGLFSLLRGFRKFKKGVQNIQWL